MIFIFCALKIEAQAFVDKFKLKKDSLDGLKVFKNSNICVIITGIGIKNISKSIDFVLNNISISKDDIFINAGICGAKKEYNIGQLLNISYVKYNNRSYIINNKTDLEITTLDNPAYDEVANIVDMEAFGFYDRLKNIECKKYIFKVVSDHFEPQKVTKDKTKELIFKNIDSMMEIIY